MKIATAALAALMLSSSPVLAHQGHTSAWTGAETRQWRFMRLTNYCAMLTDANARGLSWKTENAKIAKKNASDALLVHDFTVHQAIWIKDNCPWVF